MTSLRLYRAFLSAATFAALAATSPMRPAIAAAELPSLTLAVPQRANAHVSMDADGAFVAAAWSASVASGATDIYAATSVDGGRTFASPVRVNSTPGDARVNGEQPPRIALLHRAGRAPAIAVVWTTKGDAGTVLRSATSLDGGRTFPRDTVVPETAAPGNRGWEALGAGPGNRAYTAWLDHRRLAQPQTNKMEGEHHHMAAAPSSSPQTDSVATAQLSQLYVGPIDGSQPAVAVTGGVCYCCKTAIASPGGNVLFVAWRHVYEHNMRDIAFAASHDGGKTFSAPVRVSEDRWQIDGCPDDGPAMVVDPAGRVHVVWPTVVNEKGGPRKVLFYASSKDGRAFSPRVVVPTQGQANHPQLARRADGTLVLAWDESGGGGRRLAFARSRQDAAGKIVFDRATDQAGPSGSYPVLAAVPGGVLAAWTTNDADRSVIRVAHLR